MKWLNEEQRALQSAVSRAVGNDIAPEALKMDTTDSPSAIVIASLHELGVLTMCHPKRVGGQEFDAVSLCLVMEELAKASPAAAVMCVATWAAVNVLAERPSERVDAVLAAMMEKPTLASYCLSEPRGGSDVANMETSARLIDDVYVINGTKCWVTNGGEAGVYVLFAADRPGTGASGITAFIAEAGISGLNLIRLEEKMGTRGTALAEIQLSDLHIPSSDRVGEEGEGLKLAMASQNVSRVSLAASCVGLAQAALDHAIQYSQERTQFGRPIGDFQSMQFKLADMATKVEVARCITYRAAQEIENSGRASKISRRLAAMAKMYTSDVAMEVTVDAVQIFGASGYIKGAPVEMLMRDAKVFQIFAGTNEIQKQTIFKNLQEY
jgi:butyryl-CoA dehydrogenase